MQGHFQIQGNRRFDTDHEVVYVRVYRPYGDIVADLRARLVITATSTCMLLQSSLLDSPIPVNNVAKSWEV